MHYCFTQLSKYLKFFIMIFQFQRILLPAQGFFFFICSPFISTLLQSCSAITDIQGNINSIQIRVVLFHTVISSIAMYTFSLTGLEYMNVLFMSLLVLHLLVLRSYAYKVTLFLSWHDLLSDNRLALPCFLALLLLPLAFLCPLYHSTEGVLCSVTLKVLWCLVLLSTLQSFIILLTSSLVLNGICVPLLYVLGFPPSPCQHSESS